MAAVTILQRVPNFVRTKFPTQQILLTTKICPTNLLNKFVDFPKGKSPLGFPSGNPSLRRAWESGEGYFLLFGFYLFIIFPPTVGRGKGEQGSGVGEGQGVGFGEETSPHGGHRPQGRARLVREDIIIFSYLFLCLPPPPGHRARGEGQLREPFVPVDGQVGSPDVGWWEHHHPPPALPIVTGIINFRYLFFYFPPTREAPGRVGSSSGNPSVGQGKLLFY